MNPPPMEFKPGEKRSPEGSALGALLVTLGLQAMASMALITVPVLAPAAAAGLGVPAAYVGAYVSIVYVGAMTSGLIGGSLVPRFGAIRVSQAGLVLCGAGLTLVAAGRPILLPVAALLVGLGYGPITPASSHILARSAPADAAGLIFSIKQTGVPLGGAIAGMMVPPLVATVGWRIALLCVAGACLAAMALAQPARGGLDVGRQERLPIGVSRIAEPLRMVWTAPSLRALALLSAVYAAMQMCLLGYLVTYLVHDLGFSLARAGGALSVANGAGIVGRVLWGRVSDRWVAPGRVLGLLGLIMTGGAALTAAFTGAWPIALVIAVCAAYGASAIGWNGVHLAQVARLAPEGAAGLATGGCLFFTFAGVVIGPAAFGALAASGAGYPTAYLAAALPALLMGLRFVFRPSLRLR